MTFPHGDSPSITDVSLGGQDHEPVPKPKRVGPRSPLAIVDIETTGLYDGALVHDVAVASTRDGLWSTKIVWPAEVIKVHRDTHAPWCALSGTLNPGRGRCNACDFKQAQKITGYPDEGHTDGMTPDKARESLYSALDGHAIIAHNGLSFDMPRLKSFLCPYELPGLSVDSMHMMRLLFRQDEDCKGFSLDKLSDYLGLEREGVHEAMSGVMQLSAVVKRVQGLIKKGLEYEALDECV